MADLTITATSVVAGVGASKKSGVAGVAITAGQTVYLDTTTNSYKLADNDNATVAARSPAGIALHGAAAGQPLAVHEGGDITIGATLTPGTVYFLSANGGGICPVADLGTGKTVTIVGVAKSASVLSVKFHESGVTL